MEPPSQNDMVVQDGEADAMNDNEDNDSVFDETPHFLDEGDAVEVQVDEDNIPMDDDDDDTEMEQQEQDQPTDTVEVVEDMSRVKLESHTGPVYAVRSFFDTNRKNLSIVSGGGDDKAFLHRIAASADSSAPPATQTHPLEHKHTDTVSCVAFNIKYVSEDLSKTPRLAAVGSYDGSIVLYSADTGEKVDVLEGPSEVEWLSFHSKGGTVLLAGSASDGTVWMFNLPLKRCLQVFVGHESATSTGAFTPDGKWALSASSDGTLRIWAPRTGKCKHVFKFGGGGGEYADGAVAGLTCIDVNGGSDGQLVLVGSEDGQAHVCHVGTKKIVTSLRHYDVSSSRGADAQQRGENGGDGNDDDVALPMSVEAVGFAPPKVHPGWCATAGVDGVLKIWDLTNDGQCRQICRRPEAQQQQQGQRSAGEGGITRLSWHPSLPLVFTAGFGVIDLWDARDGKLVHELAGGSRTEVINDMDIQYADDGRTAIIVSGSDDKAIRVYELDIEAILKLPQ